MRLTCQAWRAAVPVRTLVVKLSEETPALAAAEVERLDGMLRHNPQWEVRRVTLRGGDHLQAALWAVARCHGRRLGSVKLLNHKRHPTRQEIDVSFLAAECPALLRAMFYNLDVRFMPPGPVPLEVLGSFDCTLRTDFTLLGNLRDLRVMIDTLGNLPQSSVSLPRLDTLVFEFDTMVRLHAPSVTTLVIKDNVLCHCPSANVKRLFLSIDFAMYEPKDMVLFSDFIKLELVAFDVVDCGDLWDLDSYFQAIAEALPPTAAMCMPYITGRWGRSLFRDYGPFYPILNNRLL